MVVPIATRIVPERREAKFGTSQASTQRDQAGGSSSASRSTLAGSSHRLISGAGTQEFTDERHPGAAGGASWCRSATLGPENTGVSNRRAVAN